MNDRHDDDPARGFLDQTVPREDEWLGVEPEEDTTRPRHVQYPTAPEPLVDPKVRRKETIKRAALSFGPSLGYTAAVLALSGDSDEAPQPQPQPQPQPRPEPEPDMGDHPDMDMDMDYGGYGEAGSGL